MGLPAVPGAKDFAMIFRTTGAVLLLLLALTAPAPAQTSSLYDRNQKATFDGFWAVGAEPWGHPGTRDQVTLRYARPVVLPMLRDYFAPGLISLFGWGSESGIVEIGCGFGWLLEALASHGVTRSVGTETSTYIQLSKSLSEDLDLRSAIETVGLVHNAGDGLSLFGTFRDGGGARARRAADILNEGLSTTLSRRAVRDAIRAKGVSQFDVVTFDLFSILTDSEAQSVSANAHAISGASRVIHVVSTSGSVLGNYHTLAEWKTLLPNDLFVDISTFEVQ